MPTRISPEVIEVARTIEALTGVPPAFPKKIMAKIERREQKARVRRLLALPPLLQEGAVCYGENILKSYSEERV